MKMNFQCLPLYTQRAHHLQRLVKGFLLKLAPMMPPCGHWPFHGKYQLRAGSCLPAFQGPWEPCSSGPGKVVASYPPHSYTTVPLHPRYIGLLRVAQSSAPSWCLEFSNAATFRLCLASAWGGTNRFQEASHMISGSQWAASVKAVAANRADVSEVCIGSSGDLLKSVEDLYC